MISQVVDLFGTPEAPVATKRTAHQSMLFAGSLFDYRDPNATPAPAPELDPELHDATIDDAIAAEPAALDGGEGGSAPVAVGDRFADPNLLGSPCLVTEVDPAGEWFEARWIPGAPAYRYPTRQAARWVRVAPAADDRPELVDPADLTADDIAGLVARSTEVTDAYLADRLADVAGDDAEDLCPVTGMTRAERDAAGDAPAEAPPAPVRPAAPVVAGTRRVPGANDRDFRYVGVVRVNGGRGGSTGRIVAECGHEHANRDWSTGAAGGSAKDCARQIIAGAQNPATAEHTAKRIRTAPTGLRPGAGFQHPAGTIEAAAAIATSNAEAYLAAVATVRAHLGR
jgi:hypothetical protein